MILLLQDCIVLVHKWFLMEIFHFNWEILSKSWVLKKFRAYYQCIRKLSQTIRSARYCSYFIGIVLGIIVGSIPFQMPNIPVPVKIGLAGGPLIIALILSRFGNKFYLNNYTTNSTNLMIRELGITLFLPVLG